MYLENLSTSILRICDERELTYEKASEKCNISTRYFGDIVRRKTYPSIHTLEKICMGLKATPNEVLLKEEITEELKYRIPQAVTKAQVYRCQGGEIGYPVCPRCGVTLEREYQRYCDRCGQKLDWSNFPGFLFMFRKDKP